MENVNDTITNENLKEEAIKEIQDILSLLPESEIIKIESFIRTFYFSEE